MNRHSLAQLEPYSVDVSTEEGTHGRYQVRRAVEALSPSQNGPQRPLEALEAVRHAQHALSDARDFFTTAARRDGASWAEIGTALGITRQAVQQSHQRRQTEADQRAEDVRIWHMPAAPRRRRFRWPFRRAA